jgi:hypothetical protein
MTKISKDKSSKNKFQKPYVKDVYSLETLILNFIPGADFDYDNEGQLIIYTNLSTDDDGNLIEFTIEEE